MHSALVDFHCHLDLYPDHAGEVQRCEANKVFTLAVTTTPRAWPRNHQLAEKTRHVRAALGLHPQLVGERAHEIAMWEELLPRTRYVGEVGLDAGPRYFKSFEQQKAVFERILTLCAATRNKVISVHSVRSATVVLDMIEKHLPPSQGRVVLHWFTGNAAEARRAIDLGCFFSINSEMLANQKRRALTDTLPIDRLLTETDGPFTRTNDRPSVPNDVRATVAQLAELKSLRTEELSKVILSNLGQLLREQV